MKPEFAILEGRTVDRMNVFVVDTKNAKYQGIPWHDMGDFGKRKFENILVLQDTGLKTIVKYV